MNVSGTNLTYTKAYNFRIVFETIRLYGPISRAEIARKTNLTAQTVSNIVSRLLDRSFIMEGNKLQKQRGAPSTNLIINPHGAYSIGIDFNRDHLTGILVDLNGSVISKHYYEINSPNPLEAVDLISNTVFQLMDNQLLQNSHFSGIGVGFPGPLFIKNKNGLSKAINPKAFPNWTDVPIIELLHKQLNETIYLENNATAAAIGELWYGAGKKTPNFLFVFLGAGLGGGIVINSNIYEGSKGNAGELGYFPFIGQKSPLSDSEEPHIGEHFNLNKLYKWLEKKQIIISRPEELRRLLQEENETLLQWLDLGVKYLAPVLLTAEYLLDIDSFIIGGRLPKEVTSYIINHLPEQLRNYRIDLKTLEPDVILGTAGPDAAALGAATLPMFNLFSAQTDVLMKKVSSNTSKTE